MIQFATDFKTYTQAGKIVRYDSTLGYHFINTGNCILYVNNIPIYPSGVLDTMISGCQDTTTYQLRFDTSATATNPELSVITFNKTSK